ncbi:MAG: hypothetical protein R2867_22230 [Caldilineaceae bacterium]
MTTTNSVTLPPDRLDELVRLFTEFRTTYLPSADAQQDLTALVDERAMAERNYHALVRQADQGTTSTDDLLLKLLPHTDNPIQSLARRLDSSDGGDSRGSAYLV